MVKSLGQIVTRLKMHMNNRLRLKEKAYRLKVSRTIHFAPAF